MQTVHMLFMMACLSLLVAKIFFKWARPKKWYALISNLLIKLNTTWNKVCVKCIPKTCQHG